MTNTAIPIRVAAAMAMPIRKSLPISGSFTARLARIVADDFRCWAVIVLGKGFRAPTGRASEPGEIGLSTLAMKADKRERR
jgi:hypothetical protein